MIISDEKLAQAGFTRSDLQKIKNNVDSYGGTFGEAIQDLANRFRILIWISCFCSAVFAWLVFSGDVERMIAGGISLVITMLIVIFIQPPVLSYKSWRYWRANRN
ncbi:hypothetical protein J2125_001113 [Erwinia toletana]|uniref:Uncharacterized protein n=1 Tax=Winslowiella toletana TaxID=92490 RepID=A0ABS4P772_9GAMM|nr:hypothetical protein [Winslowiella toletana]MBP2167921.1 hypothetical protein [Winslowiella toletana]